MDWLGAPNPKAEPGMQWVARRTSKNIWHWPHIRVRCEGDKGIHEVVSCTGSQFPIHRLWINSKLEKDIDQGTLADLWDPDSDDESFVE